MEGLNADTQQIGDNFMQTAEKKNTFAYSIRPMAESDIEATVEYINECAALETAVESVTLEEFLQWHNRPSNDDHETLAFILDEEGNEVRIIGDMNLSIHPPDTRCWGWLHVHPDYRNNGVGSALYAEYMRLAEEAGATEMSINPNREATLLIDFLEKRGHKLERWFWDMQLPAEQEVEPTKMPEGFITHTFMRGQDEELLADVRNATFAEHYGFVHANGRGDGLQDQAARLLFRRPLLRIRRRQDSRLLLHESETSASGTGAAKRWAISSFLA